MTTYFAWCPHNIERISLLPDGRQVARCTTCGEIKRIYPRVSEQLKYLEHRWPIPGEGIKNYSRGGKR